MASKKKLEEEAKKKAAAAKRKKKAAEKKLAAVPAPRKKKEKEGEDVTVLNLLASIAASLQKIEKRYAGGCNVSEPQGYASEEELEAEVTGSMETETPGDDEAPTEGDVKDAVRAALERTDSPTVTAVFKTFKIKRTSEAKENMYPALIAALEKLEAE